MKEIYDYKEIEQEVQDRWDQQKPYEANIDTKNQNIIAYQCCHILQAIFTWATCEIIQ